MSLSTPTDGQKGGNEVVCRAADLWKKAQVVYQSPSCEGQPEARVVAEQIALSQPECEPSLKNLLSDENPLVAAYALVTLELMKSTLLQDLPAELLQRRSQLTLMSGSVKTAMDLGGLARQIQRRARSVWPRSREALEAAPAKSAIRPTSS
jgi:hypothetical protein